MKKFFNEGLDAGFELDTKTAGVPGAGLSGVYEATDFLIRANADSNRLPEDIRKPLEIGRRVVVIGDGDMASDCLCAALRLGSEDVTCLSNSIANEMLDETENRKAAREEGVKYRFLTQPVKFLAGADGRLAAVECVEMKLGEPDADGRRKPVPVEGSNFSVAADTAIISNTTSNLEAYNRDLFCEKDEIKEGAFISRDCFTGSNLVAALESGRKSALAIDEYLQNKK